MSPTELTPARPARDPAAPYDPKAVSVRLIQIMADGDLPDFEAVIHRDGANREARKEPMAARGRGPAAFYASALWLRAAFSDLSWDIHEIAADGELVVLHTTLSARHAGPFVTYDDAGAVSQVMPPTGKAFSATQTHWLRHADGKIIEHWANRDDLGLAQQAGWVPPTPRYLARMALAKRRARAAAAQEGERR